MNAALPHQRSEKSRSHLPQPIGGTSHLLLTRRLKRLEPPPLLVDLGLEALSFPLEVVSSLVVAKCT